MLIVFGLTLGSFVNAFVWRFKHKKDWVNGRSQCIHCGHILGPLDLIPILSWLLLRGRCRYCHKKIEDSPLVELILPLLFVLSYVFWPVELTGIGLIEFIFWLIFLVGFMALAVYDLRWFILPNRIVFPLIGLAVVQVIVVAAYAMDWRVVLEAFVGVLVVAGIFYLLFQLSKGTWIGGGDVKLGIVLGILAGGLIEGFLLLFAASLAGMLATLPLVVRGKAHRKTQLPFGPFLILGLIIVKLFGATIISWYVNWSSGLFHV